MLTQEEPAFAVAPKRRLPKLAPDVIHRERLSLWLAEHADFPLRLLAAPAGCGKTTALVLYATRARFPAAYLSLRAGDGAAAIRDAVCDALGLDAVADTERLLQALASVGRCEILVDDADRASDDGRHLLQRLVFDGPENVTFLYASRTREVFETTRLISLGLAALCGGGRLAFTPDEAARFVDSSRVVRGDERDVARLVMDTDGWAFAFCSTVRHAASSGRTLDAALERWQRASGSLINEFIDTAFADQEPALAARARRLFDGEPVDDATLDRLEARGMFVQLTDGVCRPYRVIARRARVASPASTSTLLPFAVELFGAPQVRFDGQRVEWIRRRDGQIFTYLALRPDGRASRRELIQAFWPDADPLLGAQSLRSACSTMRRALAAITGHAALAHYVSFGDDIALNLDLFTVDARRVRAHVADSDDAARRDDLGVAADHAAAALRIVRGPFLDGDVFAALSPFADELTDGLCRMEGRMPASDAAPSR
ncbi:MAG TPA: AAA family ATPase [Candidatus Elarobacter sp.]